MATYSSRVIPEKQSRILKLTRIWVTVAAASTLLIDVELRNHYSLWTSNHGAFSKLLEAGFIGSIVVMIQVWSPWPGWLKEFSAAAGQSYSLMISNDAVVLEFQETMRQFATRDILRADEPTWGTGIYLRTANRYRWLLIRKTLDGYAEAKNEIEALGIPVVRTAIPPNWEEFCGVLAFCASLFCDILSSSRPLLSANLVIAVLLGIGGWYVVNANPDNQKTRTKARIGVWIPAICAAVALYLAS